MAAPAEITDFLGPEAAAAGVPLPLALGVLGTENGGFDKLSPSKVSPAGAKGLWQLMPDAVKAAGYDPKTFDYNDPVLSTKVGLKYYKQQLDEFKDPALAAAAYNAGPTRLRKILAAGGGPEDLPSETQNYLVAFNKHSDGALTAPKKEEAPQAQVATEAPAQASMQTAPGAGLEGTAQAAEVDPTILQKYGDTGAGLGKLYDTFVEPMTHFPEQALSQVRYAGQKAGEATGNAMADMMGAPPANGPPTSMIEPPTPIDPADAINFGAGIFPLSRAGGAIGRVGNALMGTGLGVTAVAHGLAQRDATEAGLDWDGLGTGAKTSIMMKHINTDDMAANWPSLAMSTGFGWIFGKSDTTEGAIPGPTLKQRWNKEPGGIMVGEHPITTKMMVDTAPSDVHAHDSAILFNRKQSDAEMVDRAAQKAYTLRQAQLQAENDAKNEAAHADWAAQATQTGGQNLADATQFATRSSPLENEIAGAEARTGLTRLPAGATKLEKQQQHAAMRDRILQEFNLPAEDPSSAIYENELRGPFGPRPLDPEKVASFDKALIAVEKQTKSKDIQPGRLSYLTRPLSDPSGVTPQINKLTLKAAATSNVEKRAQYLTQIRDLKSQLVAPTLNDLLDRVETIDAVRRKLPDDVPGTTRHIISELTTNLRRPGGLAEGLMMPEEAAVWARGREASRLYHQQNNGVNDVMEIFGATKPGAGTFRNRLEARHDNLVARYGPELYENMANLTRDLDTLTSGTPRAPRLQSIPDAPTPSIFKPEKAPKTTAEPLRPVSPIAALEAAKLKGAAKVDTTHPAVSVMNSLWMRATRSAGLGSMVGIGAKMAGMSPMAVAGAATVAGIAPELIASMAVNPALRRGFSKMLRASGDLQSDRFAKAAMRFYTAAVIEKFQTKDAMVQDPTQANPEQEPNAGPPAVFAPPAVPPQFRIREEPKMPTRAVGGPIPAPSRSPL